MSIQVADLHCEYRSGIYSFGEEVEEDCSGDDVLIRWELIEVDLRELEHEFVRDE